MWWFTLLLLLPALAQADLQTYAMQYRICAVGEAPVRGATGQWSCYTTCVSTDFYRSLPCVQQMPLTLTCPGIYRLSVFDTADSQGFYLTSRSVCVYPVFATCTGSQQKALCGGLTSPGCLFYDTFDGDRFLNGSCAQPYGVPTAGNAFAACTPDQLSQACYADETKCTYDQTLSHLLFECPWTPSGGAWASSNLVPEGYSFPVACTDIESETQCASDWRTRVPRESCTKYITRYREYKNHEYRFDLSQCNRVPCPGPVQLSTCATYSSNCSMLCTGPGSCTITSPVCNSTSASPTPARYCTETERLQTGCVTAAAIHDECRVRCTSDDLRTGCVLESRCMWSQGYPQMFWNALHLLPNTSQVCSAAEHDAWCGQNRDLQDPWRQDASSLCRKLCNAQGICALRDAASCNRTFCSYAVQRQACNATWPRNSRCSVLTQLSNWTNSYDPVCPDEGYSPPLPAGAANYSQAYWDSWFTATDPVLVCNATEFAYSCAPFQTMCRRRCAWSLLDETTYDALSPTQKTLADVSACTLEQKCRLGELTWTSFSRTGVGAANLVRACTTGEWHASCATTLQACKATCDLSGNNCNVTAICPWTFGYVAQPARNPNPVQCNDVESQFYCGSGYSSPCLKYNCSYIGYTDTYQLCTFDVASCNSRACNATEQLALCGYYTHQCQVKCTASGACNLFGSCGTAVAQFPARPCNATELLDSCAAFDTDCRVQCISPTFDWGCIKQNICPWTSGQWIDNQLEPVPYERGLDFATAVFCGPGWVTDSYANNCELYQCTNTRRLGRHDCVCHYSTCYCPFRYTPCISHPLTIAYSHPGQKFHSTSFFAWGRGFHSHVFLFFFLGTPTTRTSAARTRASTWRATRAICLPATYTAQRATVGGSPGPVRCSARATRTRPSAS